MSRLPSRTLIAFLAVCLLIAFAVAQHSSSAPGQRVTPSFLPPAPPADGNGKYVPGEVLVRFRGGTSVSARDSAHRQLNAEVLSVSHLVENLARVRLPATTSVEAAIAAYRSNPDVLYAEPNYRVHAYTTPNDPNFSQLWGLQNIGQDGGKPGADIRATQAWDLSTGSSQVVVAVIDSGIDYTHPDLAPNMFRNAADCNSNGIDDDGNGYVDDCYGIDTFNQDSNPMDDLGHGTHVAGTIGAVGNNSTGVVGINWNVQLMACKFLGANGGGDTAGAIACLDYVKKMRDRGVNIIATNNSWGGASFSQALYDAIDAQRKAGILFIAAAGNDTVDADIDPVYPAGFSLPNVIAVAATTRQDEQATFSNYGSHTVHLGAPGQEILSTTPNNTYSVYSGTSMAAPHVTGVAALLKAQDRSRDWRAIKNLLLSGGDALPSMVGTISGRRLDAYGSLTCTNSILLSRLLPVRDQIAGAIGTPIRLSALHINCGQPNGNVPVTISPGDTSITLLDDGADPDQAAGDGIYSANWTPTQVGSYTLTFPNGETLGVQVLQNYAVTPGPFSYRNITGTNLNLGDDTVSEVQSPFSLKFGGGTFDRLYVGSNGTVSFTNAFREYYNDIGIPVSEVHAITLVAPFWDDLYPVPGTDQNVFWSVTGSAPNRELVVEWRNVRAFDCRGDGTATIRFQVVFSESSSNILFQYADAFFGGACSLHDRGASATIGVQVSPGAGTLWSYGQGFDSPYNAQGVDAGLSLVWQIAGAPPPPNPVPSITSLSPDTVSVAGPEFTLHVLGSNFVPGARVLWLGGVPRATFFISPTELDATIPVSDLIVIGAPNSDMDIAVNNPGPGGGTSNIVKLHVTAPTPSVTALVPDRVTAGGMSFRIVVTGKDFYRSSVVKWNGANMETAFDSSTELVGMIPYQNIATAGSAQISVGTPGTPYLVSNSITLPIDAPVFGAPPPNLSQVPGNEFTPFYLLPDGSHGPLSPNTRPPMRGAARFLGWNRARQLGPAYIQQFSRPAGSREIEISSGNVAPAERPAVLGNALPPGGMPGLKLRESLPTDYLPSGIAVGDFDRDGHKDWAICNGGSNSVWVYLGRGDGTAEPPRIVPLRGESPVWLAAADLRGNGITDLVVAEADSGTVGVLLGRGDGTFEREALYVVPSPVYSLVIGDFTGDHKLDIAVAMSGAPSFGPIGVFPGLGNGTFGNLILSPSPFPAFVYTWMAAGDLDNDGDPDIVVIEIGSGGSAVRVFLNQGDGTFKRTQYLLGSSPFANFLSVELGDFNEDGCLDFVTSLDIGTMGIAMGHCDGNFDGYPSVIGTGSGDAGYGLTVGDFDGDGHLDIAAGGITINLGSGWGQEAGNLLCIVRGDGHGRFQAPRVYRGESSMYAIAPVDLNGDGKLDVVSANLESESTTVFLNRGGGDFDTPRGGYLGYEVGPNAGGTSNAPARSFRVLDVNGDGKPDLVTLEWGQYYPMPMQIAVLLNDGSGQFSDPIRSPAFESTITFGDWGFGDFRKTGRPDFLAIGSQFSNGAPLVVFSPNRGDGSFGPPRMTMLSGAMGMLGIGDFNGDGDLDFVVAGPSSVPGNAQQLQFYRGNGDGTIIPGAAIVYGGTDYRWPSSVAVGDFNRDGKLDVLVHLYENVVPYRVNDVFEFLGNGDGTFSGPRVVIPNSGPIAVADLDHDGLPDIVEEADLMSTYPSMPTISFRVYLGQPDGSFPLSHTYSPFAGTPALVASPSNWQEPLLGDFNGDGNLDIVALQSRKVVPTLAYAQFLMGNGDGTFAPAYSVFEFHKFLLPQSVGDVTGDGRADLIELDHWPSSFHVIPGGPGPALQAHLTTNPVIGSTGRLRINLDAVPSTATTVSLSASDAAITLPASVDFPPGVISQDITFQVGAAFDPTRAFAIRAQLGADTAVAYGTQAGADARLGLLVVLTELEETVQASETSRDYHPFVNSLGGYTTTAQLSCEGLPLGAACLFGTNSIELPPGGYLGLSMVVSTTSATPPGTYTFNVVASDGILTDRVSARLLVFAPADFSIGVSPASQTVRPGSSAAYNISLGALNGFNQTVQVGCSGLPEGAACSLQGSWLAPSSPSMTSPFSVSVPASATAGDFNFTVTGTFGSASHSAGAELRIQNFTGSFNTGSATIPVGSSAKFTVTLSSQNGLTDQFAVSCLNPPSGITCSFNPTPVTLPSNGTINSELTVQVSARPAAFWRAPEFRFRPQSPTPFLIVSAIGFLACFSLSGWFARRTHFGRLSVALLLLAMLPLLGIVACSGSGSSNPPPPPPPPPAPKTVSLSIQASSPSMTKTIGTITITVP